MVVQRVSQRLCDECGEPAEKVHIRLRSGAFSVDLCDTHREPYEALRKRVVTSTRGTRAVMSAADFDKATTKKKPAPRKGRAKRS